MMNDKLKKIDDTRLSKLMKSGRGKQKDRFLGKSLSSCSENFDPINVFNKMKDNDPWTDRELAVITRIPSRNIGKLRRGVYYLPRKVKNEIKEVKGSTQDTINKIAEALDVDPEYLTGEQIALKKKKLTPEEEERRKRMFEDLDKSRNLRILKDLLKIYSVNIKFDDDAHPSKYWLFDSDGDVIKNGEDVEDLNGLIEILFNYLNTGADIIQLFFGPIYTTEF